MVWLRPRVLSVTNRKYQAYGASLLPGLALLVLGIAGLVLATSWAVPYSASVLSTAWMIAFLGMAAATYLGWRDARQQGVGLLTALARSLRALGRFLLAFF